MTSQKILEEIRNVCDLKKLKEGCKFWIYSGDHKTKLNCTMISDTHYKLDTYPTKNHYVWEITEKEIIESGGEIIGKPPTLEHLLRTLKEEYVIYPQTGDLILIQFENENRDFTHYDLTKPLLEQSEKVIETLLKIIK